MHSLAQEIQGFSKKHLKKQSTRVTTVTGKKLLETRSDEGHEEQVQELEEEGGCGFVEDKSLDLQVGAVRPFLLLGNIFYLTLHFTASITALTSSTGSALQSEVKQLKLSWLRIENTADITFPFTWTLTQHFQVQLHKQHP